MVQEPWNVACERFLLCLHSLMMEAPRRDSKVSAKRQPKQQSLPRTGSKETVREERLDGECWQGPRSKGVANAVSDSTNIERARTITLFAAAPSKARRS